MLEDVPASAVAAGFSSSEASVAPAASLAGVSGSRGALLAGVPVPAVAAGSSSEASVASVSAADRTGTAGVRPSASPSPVEASLAVSAGVSGVRGASLAAVPVSVVPAGVSSPSWAAAGFAGPSPVPAPVSVPFVRGVSSGSAERTQEATASRSRPSRVDSTRVAVSTRSRFSEGPAASRATANRGSRFSGTGPALPDVGSADDSRCFDLSGDSPATDASSLCRTPRVRQPNREPPAPDSAPQRCPNHVPVSCVRAYPTW
ncbi:serine/arginine repetitive matrix protein 1 [Streptomyces griseoflavus Tu4000]|uniref:Serine/arginine repetitive matrix protein 1 n=1 Tax=Streptomyces griseoflavus Tu4000 TaxID=467200 RepID=D9XUI2_9ACTN|nr:serine/arginine repetitive matrix protein 1 [Streptomyces griseoflavus Tu4000]